MGFKSKARKARGESGKSEGQKRRRKELGDGEKPCCIKVVTNGPTRVMGDGVSPLTTLLMSGMRMI
ncbi:MAG: hypothetical protein Ct9H90mP16_01560 [Candidatus Poseidoniales archaeon]|nr:MAG: hypothetical protein Ct9H90mP16_01560 [Candidatus Poseidoniales archaeon]